MTQRDDRKQHLRELVTLLERTIEARQELLDQLTRVAAQELGGPEGQEWESLHQRLADLTRKQEMLLDRLSHLLPPDELGDQPAAPNG